jgi:hypothetical protein
MPRVDVQHPTEPAEWNRWFNSMEEAERYKNHMAGRGYLATIRPELTIPENPVVGMRIVFVPIYITREEDYP